jgi:hypothetical protein
LGVNAVRDSSGFDCIECDYEHDKQDIDPAELSGCRELWDAVFNLDVETIPTDLEHRPVLLVRSSVGVWKPAPALL